MKAWTKRKNPLFPAWNSLESSTQISEPLSLNNCFATKLCSLSAAESLARVSNMKTLSLEKKKKACRSYILYFDNTGCLSYVPTNRSGPMETGDGSQVNMTFPSWCRWCLLYEWCVGGRANGPIAATRENGSVDGTHSEVATFNSLREKSSEDRAYIYTFLTLATLLHLASTRITISCYHSMSMTKTAIYSNKLHHWVSLRDWCDFLGHSVMKPLLPASVLLWQH